MRLRRRSEKVMYDPPAVMLADLAFNLVIFFVCIASTDPESGRRQVIPRSSKDESAASQQQKNVEISLTPDSVSINGIPTKVADFPGKLGELLKDKTRTEDRMVVLKSLKNTPYQHWIHIAGLIEQAGGIIALQVEEAQEVPVK